MNFRLTAIIFGLAAGLLAVLFLVAVFDDDGKDKQTTSDSILGTFASIVKEKEVDALEIVRTETGEEKLGFVKLGDGKWELREPFVAKVEGFAIDAVIRDLFRAKPVKYAELTDSLKIHGLDNPSIRVTVRKGAEQSATINLGLTTIGGNKAVTFITTAAESKRPLAVNRNDLNSLFRESARAKDGPAWEMAKWLADYRVKKLLGADLRDPASELQAIKLTAGGKELVLNRTASGTWTFASPAGYGDADDLGESTPQPPTAPFTGIRPLLTALTGLQAMSVEDYIEKPDDLAKYGLKIDDPSLLRIELKGKTGNPEVLFVGKPVEENGKPVVPTRVYCRLDGDSAVVKVTTDRADALRSTAINPADLRNKDLLPPTSRAKIDALDLIVGTSTVKLRKVQAGGDQFPKWVIYGGAEPTEAKATEVESLLTVLTKARAATEVLTAPNDAAFAGPELKATVKVWFDGQEKAEKVEAGKLPAEPKLKGTPTELTFGKKDGPAVFVRKTIEAAKVDLKLSDAVLVLVTKSRLDLLEPKLKSFPTLIANKLTFNRGTEVYEMSKADTGTWPIAQPVAKKGLNADPDKMSNLLGVLAGIQPERVISEQPSVDDLKKWGLDPAAPRMKVTVGLTDSMDKERVYEFGAEAEPGKSVYARQTGRPIVFTVNKLVFDKFAEGEIRDAVVFRLDPAKVKKLKLRGWKGLVNADPLVYQFEKSVTGWTAVAPTPAGYNVDSVKITALLTALAAPRAESFIGPGKPEHGTDVAANAEGIEFTIEFDAGPAMTLVLGAKATDGKVYAASSSIPGEVFTILPGPFRTHTEKPTGLQK